MGDVFRYPDKPRPGDRVAVLSPGVGLPEIFPAPYELGLRRLQETYGVEVVEYPTTRKISAPADRAADVNAAFADPAITAVLTSIGGDDQIKILKHLDADLIAANPKPFFGLSDNTNLHNFLWNLGIVSYYGGVVMTDHGRPGSVNPHSQEAFRAAFFGDGWYDLRPAESFTDVHLDWADPANLEREPEMLPGTGWEWHGGPGRSRAGCGAAAWRSSTSTCAPRGTSRPTTRRTTGACCTSRPPRRCPPPSTSARC